MEQKEEVGYWYGPLERRGWLFGVRGGQLALAVLGLGGAVLLVNIGRTWWGALSAAAWALFWLGLAFLPVEGRGADEWAGVVAAFVWSRLIGRREWQSEYPLVGFVSDER